MRAVQIRDTHSERKKTDYCLPSAGIKEHHPALFFYIALGISTFGLLCAKLDYVFSTFRLIIPSTGLCIIL